MAATSAEWSDLAKRHLKAILAREGVACEIVVVGLLLLTMV